MNFLLFIPELTITAVAFGVLSLDLFTSKDNKGVLPIASIVGLLIVLVVSLTYLSDKEDALYGGLFLIDNFSLFFKGFFIVLGILVIISSIDYTNQHLQRPGEYYGILLLSILGMMLMAASGELLTAYISLELVSFSLYVLVSYGNAGLKPSETGVKYILLGGFASAILLYGISQIYGVLGTTQFHEIHVALIEEGGVLDSGVLIGLTMVIVGMGFKIAAVPFHMWAPDVYEGSPTPITAYLAVGSKAAAFALIMRLFSQGLMPAVDNWQTIIVILSAVTMTLGNLVALAQHNIKRMLAYSSIGQVGYILMGIAALGGLTSNGIIFHLVGYGFTTLAAFLCVIIFYNATGREEIGDYSGLADRSPFLAMALSVALLSLAGLPFFVGFTSKFYLFTAAADGGLIWLVGIAITASLISLYYYLMVMKQMYMLPSEDASSIRISATNRALLWSLTLTIVVLGIFPSPLINTIQSASNVLFP